MAENPQQTVVNLGGWTGKTVAYVALFCLLIGAGLGVWGYHSFSHSTWLEKMHALQLKLQAAEQKPPVVKEVVRTQTQTSVEYVPKETVVYIDPRTGRQVSAKEIESLEVNVRPTEFAFTVNGKPAAFQAEKGERWVFDKNKGKLDQWSQATVEIKIPTIDKTRRTAIIPSALYDNGQLQPGGIIVQQFGGGRFGPAGQIGAFGGGHYTFGIGGSF